jgi:hypothetical protein
MHKALLVHLQIYPSARDVSDTNEQYQPQWTHLYLDGIKLEVFRRRSWRTADCCYRGHTEGNIFIRIQICQYHAWCFWTFPHTFYRTFRDTYVRQGMKRWASDLSHLCILKRLLTKHQYASTLFMGTPVEMSLKCNEWFTVSCMYLG